MRVRWTENELISWACGAVVVVCMGYLLLRWVARRWKYRDRAALAAEPRCLRCGYIIRRGSSVVCAECGSDVREKGIVTPATLPPLPVWPWYVIAAVVAGAAGWWVGTVVEERQPFGWSYVICRWLSPEPVPQRTSATGRVGRLCVHAAGAGRYFGKRPKVVLVFLNPTMSGRTNGITIETAGPTFRRWEDRAGDAHPDAAFDRAALDGLVADAAPGAEPAQRDRLLCALEADVREIMSGEFATHDRATGDALPREMLTYTLRPRPRRIVRAVCAAPVVGAALWAVRAAGKWRHRLRRAAWRRAAGRLRLVERVGTRTAAVGAEGMRGETAGKPAR